MAIIRMMPSDHEMLFRGLSDEKLDRILKQLCEVTLPDFPGPLLKKKNQKKKKAASTPELSPHLLDPSSLPTYKLTLDYGRNLKQMIAAGKFSYVHDNITQENFPIKGEGKQAVKAVIIHFGREMSSEAVLAEFERMHLDPPNLETLLALGEAEPALQRKLPIVALKPIVADPDGRRRVAYLDGGYTLDRNLLLCYCDHDWREDRSFLALRRRSS
ncbi:MAG: hypothetical protein A3B74_04980 [Candidatus Kerfeldbacteria bacterium RIFCSPHIGHO2_02_FULL_42_14]|uniref:Uncharacterized protein n=1 Tax=Candidatus Kerfeldbacteria bacterium RIFCSPHIGHO2_02_FULL_42_14 TaxID=1798540 RepID=A0A1G2ATI2_9BACT|nr:MAG: hypothetical protein A3B74_04980 [Candidatus Kerfeldbacteria bacterium RIFCSPHIGHO2_02_FULL_42_14]OGY83249.1 MAG: hypothetical protein A3I91_03685 [Candidatus Kerfeldbacteria bacterium RIFCSPLOWO2_02_FULL_42_19]OGY85694.1 MAG: hypothetical protein A3G01_00005 [Candidatus Kerfeldbacteria bacterium RIFCSPLOWO2_12_FULL_43_9]